MKLVNIFFFLLLLFLPVQLGKHFWPDFSLLFGLRVDYLSPTIYLTDLLVLGLFLSLVWEKRTLITNYQLSGKARSRLAGLIAFKKFWWAGAVFLYLLLTSLLAQNQGVAFYKLAKTLELFFLGIYIAKNARFLNYSIPQLLSLGLIYESLIVWMQFLKQGSLGGFFWFLGERTFGAGTPGIALGEINGQVFLRPYGTFSHPNSLAGFFLICLILIWGLGKNLPVWFKLFISGLGVSVVIISFSRAVWLVSPLVLIYLLGSHLKLRKTLIFGFVMLILTFFLFIVIQQWQTSPIQERVQLIRAAGEMIKTSPFLGIGLNNFIIQLPYFIKPTDVYFLQPIHNIFLLITAETGLMGLLVFSWLLILTYKKLLIANDKLLITALSSILLLGLLDHYWLTLQQNQLLAAIVFGLAWGKIKI